MGSLPASPRHADKPAVSIRTVTNSTAGLMLSPRDWKDTRASVLRQQSTRAPPRDAKCQHAGALRTVRSPPESPREKKSQRRAHLARLRERLRGVYWEQRGGVSVKVGGRPVTGWERDASSPKRPTAVNSRCPAPPACARVRAGRHGRRRGALPSVMLVGGTSVHPRLREVAGLLMSQMIDKLISSRANGFRHRASEPMTGSQSELVYRFSATLKNGRRACWVDE